MLNFRSFEQNSRQPRYIYIETYAVLSLHSFYATESPNLSLSHLEMVTKTKIQSNLSFLFKRCSTVASCRKRSGNDLRYREVST